MFALEIINALNDPDNPAKSKGLNVKLEPALPGEWDESISCKAQPKGMGAKRRAAIEAEASAALDRREERNISHYSSGRFRY